MRKPVADRRFGSGRIRPLRAPPGAERRRRTSATLVLSPAPSNFSLAARTSVDQEGAANDITKIIPMTTMLNRASRSRWRKVAAGDSEKKGNASLSIKRLTGVFHAPRRRKTFGAGGFNYFWNEGRPSGRSFARERNYNRIRTTPRIKNAAPASRTRLAGCTGIPSSPK